MFDTVLCLTRCYVKHGVVFDTVLCLTRCYIGMKRDTSLYNQLLRVYCHNNHRFVPSEFLECMKKDDCHPSLVGLIRGGGGGGGVTDSVKNDCHPSLVGVGLRGGGGGGAERE